MRINLLSLFSSLITLSVVHGFSFEGCNVTKSCWFHPPQCTANARGSCVSGVQWKYLPDGIEIQMEARITDLDPTRPYWLAVGFSYNQRMDDDTVIECVKPQSGNGTHSVSFNDDVFNYVLPQASSVLLTDGWSSLVDGILTCSVKYLNHNRHLVDKNHQFKIHDLESQTYYLLFARGNADTYTLEKDMHSTNDGPEFPWMTENQVSLCRSCSETTILHVEEMRQTFVERYWRYRIAVLHGIALLVAWWVLGSSAILIARYFKPLFPQRKLVGTSVWFQLHRDIWIVSLILQILAVVFIFYQANWVWFECTYACSSDDFSKKMHAITGVATTVLAVCQPFFALFRPAPDSPNRLFFNWLHWTIGMFAWCLASTTIVLALPMGKTGLNLAYGHIPNYIVGGYILFFIACNIILEIISTSNHQQIEKIGSPAMNLAQLHGPSKEDNFAQPTYASARIFIFFIHLMVSLAVAIAFTVMLVDILLNHSP